MVVELRGFRFSLRKTALAELQGPLNWDGDAPLSINRSPQLFLFINDFLNGDVSFLTRLSDAERAALLAEANFYGIERLENLLTPWRWQVERCLCARAEQSGKAVVKTTTSGWDCCVRGDSPMRMHSWRVLVCNQKTMIGISRKFVCSSDHWQNAEAIVLSCAEDLVRGVGEPKDAFGTPVQPGETVTLSLDYGKLRFGRGEEQWSEAVQVGEGEWYPYIAIHTKGGRIELL
jgi:hypothetical protein